MTRWWVGARPRTLPAAVVPVMVGAAAGVNATSVDGVVWWRVGLALVVSLALQVGVNYANDYSDGVRGTDDDRIGPIRLVASGLATPAAVKRAALAAFGVAAIAGLVLAASTTWWLLAVGFASIAAAWGYTGGPRPYGYAGFGELFVFVFFGLVATAGTTYVAVEMITALSILLGVGVGALACALLVINNLRDRPGDERVGKRTLAVRIGDRATRHVYVGLIAVAMAVAIAGALSATPWVAVGLVAAVAALRPVRTVLAGTTGAGLIPVLAETGRVQMLWGVAVAVGAVLSA